MIFMLVLFGIKAPREEQWLKAKFSGYAEYQKRVRKLIPFVYWRSPLWGCYTRDRSNQDKSSYN